MVEGKLEPKKILRLRLSIGGGMFGPYQWDMSINADSRLIFVEIEGNKVSFSTETMLKEALDIMIEEGVIECKS